MLIKSSVNDSCLKFYSKVDETSLGQPIGSDQVMSNSKTSLRQPIASDQVMSNSETSLQANVSAYESPCKI